jgi:hypothetical protein
MIDANVKIVVCEAYDGFSVDVGEKHYWIEQEDDRSRLVKMFKDLGFTNVFHEEDC